MEMLFLFVDHDFVDLVITIDISRGECKQELVRYYYSPRQESCFTFTWSGCGVGSSLLQDDDDDDNGDNDI